MADESTGDDKEPPDTLRMADGERVEATDEAFLKFYHAETRRAAELRALLDACLPPWGACHEHQQTHGMLEVPRVVRKELAIALAKAARAYGEIATRSQLVFPEDA